MKSVSTLSALTVTTGLHYELERLDRMEADAEAALAYIREMRREYINQHNLNKGES